MMAIRRVVAVLVLAASAGACGGETPEARRRPLADVRQAPTAAPGAPSDGGDAAASRLPPEAQLHLDSGNAAYRAKDYAGAMAHYRKAARLQPDEPAPWFGVVMAATALGDRAAADSANERVRRLSPAMQPGAHPAVPPAAESAAPAGGR